MSKTLFLFLAFSLVSCYDSKRIETIDWHEQISNVTVVIDDQLWNGEVGDTIRNKFASPVLGLQQEEPNFTLKQYPVKLLEGFITNDRNIIVIKKQSKSQFSIKENEFVKQQNIVHVSAKTVQGIIDTIQNNAAKISQKFRETEISFIQKKLIEEKADVTILEEKFKITATIPQRYKPVLNGKNFLWYKKEITSGNLSLLFYEIPVTRLKDTTNIVSAIIKTRDSIGRKYIHGANNKSRMITEPAFSPYLSKAKIDVYNAFETKGTWELNTDFMSGPFLNYAIVDKKNNRILVAEAFCYAPSKEKRNLMLELEAILKTITFL